MGEELSRAWAIYHDSIERARELIEATDRFQKQPEHRDSAYHALAEAQAMAYNLTIAPRLDHPLVHTHTSWLTHFYTLGGNCTDFVYGAIALDGRRTYRLTGRFGDLKLILLQVHNQVMGHPDSRCIGNYDLNDFDIDRAGGFEVLLSATEQVGNWIPLDASSGYNFILVRRAIADWYQDPGEMDLSVLPGPARLEHEQRDGGVAERLVLAAHLVGFLIRTWTVGFYEFCAAKADGAPNVFGLSEGVAMATDIAGSPTSSYALAVFDLGPDDALIIELDVPEDAAYWQFQLYDVWTKSLDFMHHQTDVNMHRAVLDADGRCRVVLSDTDPGVANWLDPCGRRQGSITFRNYRSSNAPTPTTRLVPLPDLREYLPADTATVTPAERQVAMETRRNGLRTLYRL